MDLPSFLLHLYSSAYSTFLILLTHLDNPTLKSLRLALPTLTQPLLTHLFRWIYISNHSTDLAVLQHLLNDKAIHHTPTTLFWDSTIYDRWISGFATYKDRLISTTPFPTQLLCSQDKLSSIHEAYTFYTQESSAFANNLLSNADHHAFTNLISKFNKLRTITILSRSRLTYIDPDAYWSTFQTPRSRAWAARPYSQYLLQPESFKPSIGTTVSESEGLRPLRIIIDTCRKLPSQLKLGALVIQSIGGGQTRASGSMNWNRYERKWHHDLTELTATRPSICAKGKVVLNLLIETQTEDLFRHESLWMTYLDELFDAGKDTTEEVTIANVCWDWLWEYMRDHPKMLLGRCKELRRVNFEGGWCRNIVELLIFLRQDVGVTEVSVSAVDIESAPWVEVLQALKRGGIMFDYFEVKASRCPADFYPWQVDSSWAAPWSGSSKDVVAWLRDERADFPLVQGPG
jgi:hypothetical protein